MTPQFTLISDTVPATNRLRAVRGTERLSQPYAFDLVVELEPNALPDLDAPVDKPATLGINDEHGNPRDEVHGILVSLELVDAHADHELYLARLVPRLWWLGQNRHSRVFVDEKLPTIFDRVLRSAGWGDDDFRFVLKGRPGKGFGVIEHVCQYRESDLDFVSRWMEREGIYYYFEEGPGGREKLVVTDGAEAHRERVAGPQPYVPRSAVGGDRREGFHAFRRTSQAQPAAVRVADYNYLNPDLPVQHEERSGAGQIISLFGENLATPDEARSQAKLRVQELRARQVTYRGVGRVYGLHPADTFSLDDHPRLTEQLLATEVVHRGLDLDGNPGLREPIADALGEELDDGYVVEVEAIPASVQYRPPRVTTMPRINGMEIAVVDGAANDRYAQLDEHGRYRIRFKFDESDLEDGRASTPVRMLQPHGGAEEGFHFPLRKGTEVMVAFVGGDPDRPFIAGVSPNPHALSPVTRSNATQNVIQTGGGNKLMLEDTHGSQCAVLSSPIQSTSLHLGAGENNLELKTKGVGRIETGSNLTIDVTGKRTDHVVQDLVENYDAAQTTTVKKRKETVLETVTEEYRGHHEQKVTAGGVTREVTGLEIETLHDGRAQTIEGGLNQTVKGGITLTHESPITQTIDNGAVKIEIKGGEVTVWAKAGITLRSEGPIKSDGATSIIETVPSSINCTTYTGTITGAMLTAAAASADNFGIKTEMNGLKAEFTKIHLHNTPLEWDDVKAKLASHGITMQNIKLKIATGALCMQLAKFTFIGR